MDSIELQLNDRSVYPQEGKIETISGVIDTSTGTVSLRAVFPNKEGLLTSGGSGNVVIPVRKENCIVVPQSATYEVQDKVYVYKVVDGKAQSVPVPSDPCEWRSGIYRREWLESGGHNCGRRRGFAA